MDDEPIVTEKFMTDLIIIQTQLNDLKIKYDDIYMEQAIFAGVEMGLSKTRGLNRNVLTITFNDLESEVDTMYFQRIVNQLQDSLTQKYVISVSYSSHEPSMDEINEILNYKPYLKLIKLDANAFVIGNV